jgi:hypothetical protein
LFELFSDRVTQGLAGEWAAVFLLKPPRRKGDLVDYIGVLRGTHVIYSKLQLGTTFGNIASRKNKTFFYSRKIKAVN